MAGNGKTNKSRIPNKRPRTTPTPRQETKRKLQPAHVNDVIDISSSAQESFNKPEEMKDNSGVHHLVKEMSAVKSSVEYLMRVVNKLAMTVFQDSPLTSGYRDSTIITPLEERNSYSLPLHTNNSKKHAGGTIIGRKLFDPESDEIIDLYTTHEPVYGINIGLKGGVKIPEWFPVIYRPPENIILSQVEAAVGAYIYADSNYTGLKGSEVLVRTTDKKFSVDRKGLKTLQPMAWVDQDVLNVVVSMLTERHRCLGDKELAWYLPTIFSQILLMNNGDKEKADLISWYKDSHMGRIDKVEKIFIPINDEAKHWYLAMIDIPKRTVYILDSLPCPSRDIARKRNVQKLVIILDEMLLRDEFQSECKKELGLCEFNYIRPDNVGKQADGSNDCGVWVATWMLNNQWMKDCRIKVTEETRFRIAVELVLLDHNEIIEQLMSSAHTFWDKYQKENSNNRGKRNY